MNEEQTSYKVTDRRLFNADGTPREVPEDEKPEPQPAKEEAAKTEPAAVTSSAAEPPTVATNTAATPETKLDEETRQPSAGDAAATTGDEAAEVDLPGAEDPASFAS